MPFDWFNGIKREDILNGYSYNDKFSNTYTVECKAEKTDNENAKELNKH